MAVCSKVLIGKFFLSQNLPKFYWEQEVYAMNYTSGNEKNVKKSAPWQACHGVGAQESGI